MDRRAFLTALVKGSAVVGAGVTIAGTVTWFSISPAPRPLTIDNILSQIAQLLAAAVIGNNPEQAAKATLSTTSAGWDLNQIFTHCAQSVEYSMTGYPQQKAEIFKHTIGASAFALFSAKGKMTHNLAEVIPGAPLISKQADYLLALKRLQQSLVDFQQYNGHLQPHFAYGKLSKQDYALAHVMHFNNHMQQIQLRTLS
ncbi:DUF1569 domain-containing protein [Shewanella sp. 10N.286.48.B5]|uniref:DUF1569 domain-containing protein n=1 Tax=Shewanella sp. 10N.286.48.B5 TaxID=1880834 RepID=UPI000C822979|nr:DUF1569 domain-containing protein [Shewanella sp. 10N.286.48.B5]PMH89380.1 hypothetical protein BCU57_00530 [Shewanella sp. 10N.286.48.B5]